MCGAALHALYEAPMSYLLLKHLLLGQIIRTSNLSNMYSEVISVNFMRNMCLDDFKMESGRKREGERKGKRNLAGKSGIQGGALT